MSNPYMRDALIDEMDQSTTAPSPSKSVRNSLPRTAPTTPASSAYAGETPTAPEPTPWAGVPATPGAGALEGAAQATAAATPPPTTAPTTAPTPATPAVAGGPQRYAGFDTQRAQDPSTSAKDSFYRATQSAPTMPQDKAGSETWFNQYIKAKLEADGYAVDWVKGDKAFVRTKENPGGEEIDFNQGADSDASSVAWQSNMAGQNTAGGAAPTGTAGGGTSLSPALTDPNVLTNITKQIETLMGAGLSLDDIMKMLSGEQPSPTTTDTGAGV